ncbi:hypothetical protein APS67_004059 [Streptomyces sp. AVP053U2]|nr:hypothetical protein APS67_004059 [Streptomyces sp. AVP053U2]
MTEPYAVTVPKGYRVGVWEVREPIATGAFGSVYAARRTGEGEGDSTGAARDRAGKAPPGRAVPGARDPSGYEGCGSRRNRCPGRSR